MLVGHMEDIQIIAVNDSNISYKTQSKYIVLMWLYEGSFFSKRICCNVLWKKSVGKLFRYCQRPRSRRAHESFYSFSFLYSYVFHWTRRKSKILSSRFVCATVKAFVRREVTDISVVSELNFENITWKIFRFADSCSDTIRSMFMCVYTISNKSRMKNLLGKTQTIFC